MLVKVFVNFKSEVPDPQRAATRESISAQYGMITGVAQGKYFEVQLAATGPVEASKLIEEICAKLLSNPWIEEYRYELET